VLLQVPPVPGVDIDQYQNRLIQRFSNMHIKDKLQRLAEDGCVPSPRHAHAQMAMESTSQPSGREVSPAEGWLNRDGNPKEVWLRMQSATLFVTTVFADAE
jgi:hypothetical protein